MKTMQSDSSPYHRKGLKVAGTDHHTITIPASTEYLTRVRRFVSGYAGKAGFSEAEIEEIRLAVDEACTNVIKHAYKNDGTKTIQISLGLKENQLIISLLDSGSTFDPGTYSNPDLQDRVRKKKRGGMGIYLIRKFMDKVEYRQKGSQNELWMTKTRP